MKILKVFPTARCLKLLILILLLNVEVFAENFTCIRKPGSFYVACSDSPYFAGNDIRVVCPQSYVRLLNVDAKYTTSINKWSFQKCKPEYFAMGNGSLEVIQPRTFENFGTVFKFDLSGNNIRTILSESFYVDRFSSNTITVNISRNKIDRIEKVITVNRQLNILTLDLRYNQLKDFNMFCLPDAKYFHLDLAYNGIKKVNPLEEMVFKGDLLLDHNELISFTISDFGESVFELLDLSFNKIQDFLCTLNKPVLINNLNLTRNQMESFNLSCLHIDLNYVDLSNNKLTEILAGYNKPLSINWLLVNNNLIRIFNISNLDGINIKFLDVSFNEITDIVFEESAKGININQFNATHNQINKFNLSYLEHDNNMYYLDLSFNKIQEFVAGDQKPNQINKLLLNHNKMKVFTMKTLAKIKKISTLNLSFNEITEITAEDEILNDLDLEWVDLSHNLIKVFNFTCLGNDSLEKLDLSFNKINDVFNSPLYQPKIGVLNLSHNSIKSLKNFAFDQSMDLIDLSFNDIESIPRDLFNNLNQLRFLNLSNNRLQNLHFTIFDGFVNLQSLDLSNNRLVSKDLQSTYRLNFLNKLYFHNNQIQTYDFSDLPKNISEISFYGNQMEFFCSDLQKLLRSFYGKIKVIKGPQMDQDHIHGIVCNNSDSKPMEANDPKPFIINDQKFNNQEDLIQLLRSIYNLFIVILIVVLAIFFLIIILNWSKIKRILTCKNPSDSTCKLHQESCRRLMTSTGDSPRE